MSSDLIRCCICLVDYHLEEHIPVMLSQCGHNTCQPCADSILKSHHRECPICRKVFSNSPDHTMYVPNRQIKERLEREEEYQSCKIHEGRLLEFYCKTDKCKVCIDCCFKKGEQSHKGHDVEKIADLKEEIDMKRKVFEEHLESCRMTHEEVKSLVQKKKQELLYNNKETERVANLVALDNLLRIRAAFDEEEDKANKISGEDSDIMKEIQAKVSEFKNIKTADIKALLEQNPEEFTKKLDNSKVQEYLQSLNDHFDLPTTPVVMQDSNKITIDAPGALKVLKASGYLKFELNADELTITLSKVLNKDMTLDLDKCDQEVKKFKVLFDKPNFNKEDLQVITYLWTRLQPQVESVDINYQYINTFRYPFLAQEHLVDFPRMIFSNPRALKSIGLSFVQLCEGVGRYLRLLGEKILPQSPNLTSLSLNLIGFLLKSTNDWIPLALKLPHLKNFKISTNLIEIARTLKGGFLNKSLLSMKALEECDIKLPNRSFDDLCALFSLFYPFEHLKRLKINLHSISMEKSELGNLLNRLKSHLKELQAVNVDIQYVEQYRISEDQVSSSVIGQYSNRSDANISTLFSVTQSSSDVSGLTVVSYIPFGNQAQAQSTLTANIPQPSRDLFNNTNNPRVGGIFSGQSQSSQRGSLFGGSQPNSRTGLFG